jgi:hypothetical protein
MRPTLRAQEISVALKPARAQGRFEIELEAASRAAVKFMKRASIELQTRKKSPGHSE